ncbi:hypothetical protein BOTCAL_0072g00080 [Botryotinia calthae]|uniref:Uncharacterized protein n=1 Tax=Botryotinia calthae TaxID=38488 RepID=A0A4Y8D8Q8_9HELO|nr:hypothetical protein BOTCAL_0072g00080 [Botryotinia calthae]
MSDNISTIYARAVADAQRAVQYVLENAPGAYERGKDAAVIAAAKAQPALNSAMEKIPVLVERSRIAAEQLYQDAPKHLNTAKGVAGQLYQDAPKHLNTAKGVAGQLYQDAPRHLSTAKKVGMNALEHPKHSATTVLAALGPIVRQHPYGSIFGAWAALAVVFGPFWPIRALLKVFGFGKGITPGSNATSWQSRQGNVQRNSWFSLCQSYGNRLN